MIKTKKQSFIVIGVFALVLMLGTVTYAFFNYTITGVANNIRTGRISFNTSQSNTLNLTNVFPMSATDAGNANLDAVSVRIQGDTTYTDGEEYEISIVDVNNTVNNKTIPINYIASYSVTPVQSGDPNVIGTNSDSYFTARGQSSAVYQLKATGEATNGEQVLIGYISSGATGIDGTLTIKAYLDSSKIAISDTYNGPESTPNANMGTTSEWVDNRVVLTTTEWNALQNAQAPLSFKIKAVSQEGIWVERPIPTIASCPGCVYRYNVNEPNLYFGENGSVLQNGDYSLNYEDIIEESGEDIFLGLVLEQETNKVQRAYACAIKTNETTNERIPFCIEGKNDNSLVNYNKNYVRNTIWNNANFEHESCVDEDGQMYCFHSNLTPNDNGSDGIYVRLFDDGAVETETSNTMIICYAGNYGFGCSD